MPSCYDTQHAMAMFTVIMHASRMGQSAAEQHFEAYGSAAVCNAAEEPTEGDSGATGDSGTGESEGAEGAEGEGAGCEAAEGGPRGMRGAPPAPPSAR